MNEHLLYFTVTEIDLQGNSVLDSLASLIKIGFMRAGSAILYRPLQVEVYQVKWGLTTWYINSVQLQFCYSLLDILPSYYSNS